MNSKKLISYVWPSLIEQGKTALGQTYEVNYENGVKVLNSENTNYSFGSLHQIMLKGIDEVLRNKRPRNILMLGLGAGSAISILKQKCKHDFELTAVEIDADLIELARRHFELSEQNVNIVNDDASHAIKVLDAGQFDLIIDDVFLDNQVPAFCREPEYLQANARLLSADGVYMRNIMAESLVDAKAYEKVLTSAFNEFYSVKHKTYGNRIYFCSVKHDKT